MKVEIDPTKSGPIGVVEGLPEGRILRLVGKNGVGKSLAANLLAIASQDYVFREYQSFESLQRVLSQVNIAINDQDHKLSAAMTPPEWKWNARERRPAIDTLGNFLYDGIEIDSIDFRRLFSCTIVRGNEGLDTQLAEMGKTVLAVYNTIFDSLRSSAAELADWALQLRNQLHRDKLEILVARIAELKEAVKEEGVDPSAVLALAEFTKLVTEVGLSYHLDQSLLALAKELKRVRDKASEELSGVASQRTDLERSLSKARKVNLEALYAKLREKEDEISRFRSKLPLREETLISPKAVDDEATKVKERLSSIEARSVEYEKLTFALEVQRDFPMLVSQREVQFRQRAVPTRDVEILHIRRPKTSRTTGQLVGDFAHSHRVTARLIKTSTDFSKLAQEHERLRERLGDLAEQKQILRRMVQTDKQVTALREELAARAGSGAKALGMLIERESRAREKLVLLEKAFAMVSTDQALSSVRKKTLGELAREYTGVTSQSLSEASQNLSARRPRFEALEGERKALEFGRKQYLTAIEEDPRYPQLAEEIRLAVKHGRLGLLSDFVDRLTPISDPAWLELMRGEVEKAILGITSSDSMERARSADPFYREMNDLLGRILSNMLNQEPFQRYVFEGRKVLRIDPAAGTVTLESDGSSLTQSLEDFSSGQRAFAYSLASISSKRRDASHSLLVLDEFGALLDEERTRFLRSHVEKLMESDKWPGTTVIIFPYKGELDQRRKELSLQKVAGEKRRLEGEKLDRLQQQLDEDGYYVEVLL